MTMCYSGVTKTSLARTSRARSGQMLHKMRSIFSVATFMDSISSGVSSASGVENSLVLYSFIGCNSKFVEYLVIVSQVSRCLNFLSRWRKKENRSDTNSKFVSW